jgi:hypothetical protein
MTTVLIMAAMFAGILLIALVASAESSRATLMLIVVLAIVAGVFAFNSSAYHLLDDEFYSLTSQRL